MANETVLLVVYGLLALRSAGPTVPAGDHLEMFWIDATVRGPATDGCPIQAHEPMVVFNSGGDWVTKELERNTEVEFPFRIANNQLSKAKIAAGLQVFPRMEAVARRAANLERYPALSSLLAGHANVPVTSISSCSVLPCEHPPCDFVGGPAHHCYFGPLTAGDGMLPHHQDVAEILLLEVPVDAWKIIIGNTEYPLGDPVVYFLNIEDHADEPVRCQGLGFGRTIGRHFERFYDIAEDWPVSKHFDRKVPLTCNSKSTGSNRTQACDFLQQHLRALLPEASASRAPRPASSLSFPHAMTAVSGRPICTMAVFE